MNGSQPWAEAFRHAAASGMRCSIITRHGEVLAIANWEAGLVEYWEAIKGKRWHEYVWHDDLPRLLEWFKKRAAKDQHITYKGLGRCSGVDQLVTVHLVKVAAPGNVWLVCGGQYPANATPPNTLTKAEREEVLTLLESVLDCFGSKNKHASLLKSALHKL